MIRWLPPASAPWLLAHEIRLAWRQLAHRPPSGRRRARWALIALATFSAFCLVLAGVASGFAASVFPLTVSGGSALIVDAVLLVLSTLMISQAISLSVQALYDRNDFDLLFSSPLRPWVLIGVRSAGIAFNVCVLYVALAAPFVITASVLGQPGWLAFVPQLIALGLGATAIGLVLTSTLFAAIGPRRTRTVAQVVAGITGGAAFLLSQAVNRDFLLDMNDGFVAPGWIDPQSAFAWPVRALTGELAPLLAIVSGGVLMFVAVVRLVGPRFATMAARASAVPVRSASSAKRSFAGGLHRVMFTKELRLLARSPQLVVQVVLSLVYVAPLAVLLFRGAGGGSAPAFAGSAVVLVAGQLASSFAWITLSAEDAPDLLASAPIRRAAADHAKLAAALVPTFALTALALVALADRAPEVTFVVASGALAAALSSALIQLWQQAPANRSSFQRRDRRSLLTAIAELLVQASWAAATGLAVAASPWSLPFAAIATILTLVLYRSPRQRHLVTWS